MGKQQIITASNTNAQTVTTTTEKDILDLTGISVSGAGATVAIGGIVDITTGGSTTSVKVQVRLGSGITGTSKYTSTVAAVAAGDDIVIAFGVTLDLGEVANQTLAITIQQVGAVADGTVHNVSASVVVG